MSEEKNVHEAKRWLKQAKADLLAARHSAENKSFEWASFQSQQAGEKALKALLYFFDYDPWGHSLVNLMEEYPEKKIKEKIKLFLDDAKLLDKYYIPTRYPNGLPDLTPSEIYTKDDDVRAIKAASCIVDTIEDII